jgi:hypothetical protein
LNLYFFQKTVYKTVIVTNIDLLEYACIASVVIDGIQSSRFVLATGQSICDIFGKATPFLSAALIIVVDKKEML